MSMRGSASSGFVASDAARPPRSMDDIEQQQPDRVLRSTLHVVAGLIGLLLLWSAVGRLDIIATAEGRLVPQTYVKIVQPAEAGVIEEILVGEGQRVSAGQVLMRMDAQGAPTSSLATHLAFTTASKPPVLTLAWSKQAAFPYVSNTQMATMVCASVDHSQQQYVLGIQMQLAS